MKRGIRQKRHCLYCENQVKEYWYNGRFKNYSKTCEKHHGYEKRRGKFNPSWRGGRIKRQGYIYILVDERFYKRGMSRYKAEHQIVAEKKYNRKIEKIEVVHHLNGVRDDNRPENLVIIRRKGH